MDLKKAIAIRISRRSYRDGPLREDVLEQLRLGVEECNRRSGLNIRMILDDPAPFTLGGSRGMFHNAHNYFALVGDPSDPDMEEKMGYFGESLVLLATQLGLGTCWVAGTYDKQQCSCEIGPDETLRAVIVFGRVSVEPSVKEKMIRRSVVRRTKEIKDMLRAVGRAPNWVVQGMRCVVRAPSAVNRQPVSFFYADEAVTAKVPCDRATDMLDLGIAKLHFEIGAEQGSWNFGNGGVFTRDADEDIWEEAEKKPSPRDEVERLFEELRQMK